MSKDNIGEFETTAANNTDINGVSVAEGWAPSNVNNSIRALMDLMKRADLDQSGTLDGGGTADVITIAVNQDIATYIDGMRFRFYASGDNTTVVTFNVDSVGAKKMAKLVNGVETVIAAGDIQGGGLYETIYDATIDSSSGGWWLIDLNHSDIIGTPPGSIQFYAASSAPTGWLVCNGSTVSRTTYADLFAVIGDVFGIGDGSTTFEIPDLRGQFVRGYDNGAGIDPDAASRTDSGDGSTTGDNIGTKQADAFKSHTHTINSLANNGASGSAQDARQTGGTSGATGDNETRPINVSLNYIIKT